MKKGLAFLSWILFQAHMWGGSNTDSLRQIIQQTSNQQQKIEALFELGKISEQPQRRTYLEQSLALAQKQKDALWVGHIYEEIGNIFYPNEVDSFAYYYSLSQDAYELSGDKENIAKGCNNMGIVYWFRNELSVAISYYLRALEINKSIGNRRNYAINCHNIALLYQQLEDNDNALLYLEQLDTMDLPSLIAPEFVCVVNNTKGIVMMNLGRLDEAKAIHQKNAQISIEIGDSIRAGHAYENLGLVYQELDKPDSAIYCYEKSILYFSTQRQDFEVAGFYNNIAAAHLDMRNYKASLHFYNKALEFGLRSGYKPWILATYNGLAEVYTATKDYKQAVDYFQKTLAMKDSLIEEENQSLLNELEAKFESKQKEQEIQLLKKNDELNQIELKNNEMVIAQQEQRQWFFAIAGFSLIVLVVVILVALMNKRKSNRLLQMQKTEIEHQHLLLVEKNTEIIDSLNYSKRLQSAILPPLQRFEKFFESHFIYYLPKDIVSGDFYWLEEQQGKVNLAVADCTGHGVPGAIVSVVCANTLSRVLFEDNPQNPAAMLDQCREQVKLYFGKNEEQINDGMDISLCSLSLSSRTLNWAGANNPLWIMRNGELLEWKPDKQPIGAYSFEKPFTNNEIQLEKGDVIYLFSDGYQDQFGGEKGKKFKASNLKLLLQRIGDKTLVQQCELIHEEFEKWRGKLEQVDDICIIGVRV